MLGCRSESILEHKFDDIFDKENKVPYIIKYIKDLNEEYSIFETEMQNGTTSNSFIT